MIHEAYMPVYRCPDFHCAGSTRGSTRGPRGPKKDIKRPFSRPAETDPYILLECLSLISRSAGRYKSTKINETCFFEIGINYIEYD